MSLDIKVLVKGVAKLASLPEVCVRVNEMVEDPNHSTQDIAKVISQDPALTAQLLRISNSAFFNAPAKVDTIFRAITLIGERELRYLVLAMSAVRSFNDVPSEAINMASFWRHSVYCGVIARLIARRNNVLHSERLFVAGLLHDVGLLVLLMREPALVLKVLEQSDEVDQPLFELERTVCGCDHAEIGGALLASWNLPSVLCETVACHHHIDKAEEAELDAAIIHVADVIANKAERSRDYGGALPQYNPAAWERLGMSDEVVVALMREAEPLFSESWALIQPMARHAK